MVICLWANNDFYDVNALTVLVGKNIKCLHVSPFYFRESNHHNSDCYSYFKFCHFQDIY
jgi:hypothetical protein